MKIQGFQNIPSVLQTFKKDVATSEGPTQSTAGSSVTLSTFAETLQSLQRYNAQAAQSRQYTPVEVSALDMDWRHWRKAAERGLLCVINPDAHDTAGLTYVSAGVAAARKGWLTKEQVLNTRTLAEVTSFLRAKVGT